MAFISGGLLKRCRFLLLIPILYFTLYSKILQSSRSNRALQTEFVTSNPKNLRFLTFGTSRTYGSGLDEREKAYPYLLSPDVQNLAIRASGPDFPALCTATMVGAERYDVIIMEYFLRSHDNLDVLAKRLRERFPKATIIFVVTRPPFLFRHDPSDKSLKELLQIHGARQGWDPEMVVESALNGTKPEEWSLQDPPELMEKVREVAKAVKGYVFELRVPNDQFEAIRWYARDLFIHDQTHYSEYGHKVVYHGIHSILEVTKANRSDALGEWEYKDNCDLWFQSGETKIERSPEMRLGSFGDHHKYAIEVRRNVTGWIEINNPSLKEASLYVQYMATNPPRIYPLANLSINGDSVIANPTVMSYKYAVHVTKLIKVSTRVPPGVSTLHIESLESNSVVPFRITGIIVTPAENVTIRSQ